MTPLVWAGIACAAALAAVGLWAWLWRTPRVWPQIREVTCEHMAMTVTAIEARKKQWRCHHGCVMTEGYIAYDRDAAQALDVIAEPDQARAEHMNRTLRRAEGRDEHG